MEYEAIPRPLRDELARNAAVVMPGRKVWLHPRIPEELPEPSSHELSDELLAAIALETYWDENPAQIGHFPRIAGIFPKETELTANDLRISDKGFAYLIDRFAEKRAVEQGKGAEATNTRMNEDQKSTD